MDCHWRGIRTFTSRCNRLFNCQKPLEPICPAVLGPRCCWCCRCCFALRNCRCPRFCQRLCRRPVPVPLLEGPPWVRQPRPRWALLSKLEIAWGGTLDPSVAKTAIGTSFAFRSALSAFVSTAGSRLWRRARAGQWAGKVRGEVVMAVGLAGRVFAFKGLGESWRVIALAGRVRVDES